MARRRLSRSAVRAIRVLVALIAVGGCLAAVALAATRPGLDMAAQRPQKKASSPKPLAPRPPRPTITRHPAKMSTSASAGFAFKASQPNLRFQCQLDRERWSGCTAPLILRELTVGDHRFGVRALSRAGRRGAAARFRWRRFESKQFAIEPQLQDLPALFPGAPAVALPVLVRNPNPVPIRITALRVAVSADAPGCDRANLELIPAGASAANPLRLPAGGSLSLPTPSATSPAIALRDLPVNQDACQGAHFPLVFSGEAHG
jgi:hypothetical protein